MSGGASITPVILSGGSGSRLWPASRSLNPKQFHDLACGPVYGRSILQETAHRVRGKGFNPPLIICNHEHRFMVIEQLRDIDMTPADIILEPVGRNTAPAAAAAALMLVRDDPEALMLVMPSDHVIADVKHFYAAVETATVAARAGALVAFGITPDRPETGYGYILGGAPLEDVKGCSKISRFIEKPDAAAAEGFLKTGGYSWNSGIFVFTAARYLEELERLQPAIIAGCRQAVAEGRRDGAFFRLGAEAFATIPSNSIDYAVMERTKTAAVTPVNMGWSDLGSWASLWEVAVKDKNGNALSGDVTALDTADSYIRSHGPLVATVGVKDIVVVAMDDAVLVLAKDKAEEVKALYGLLAENKRKEIVSHLTVYRPWGSFTTLKEGDRFKVKQLTLNPGAGLSLQRHRHRAEHWTVVDGTARVTRGDETFDLHENQSAYIPAGARHRLENPGRDIIHVIEVQTGSYLEEDDIERFEDIYGRE
ncbi:MAG: mannose-1-phosphate guanylyltransferase/mannose-6-phosphate isomerase [Rhodospirillales bacterium RIFCSPLOWO2_12_FULL_58_28]|nr:MAG: mannose-1-phosphate guanylyltransferase/mannose-6-phosphate isomerase [Rhodospirillales bacterium RIFCSPLOWO2_02_FULL_58_16]OHC78893.1 MAG: mannose-1-phosphate guanylyltransferase/mannose-6-phosphate isomerase [Rhodospirillales bacterium RIFCSPLOWO2_12_FULL_58_28]